MLPCLICVWPCEPFVQGSVQTQWLVVEVTFCSRWLGEARVEVLLRQQAFKPRTDIAGNKLSGEKGASTL